MGREGEGPAEAELAAPALISAPWASPVKGRGVRCEQTVMLRGISKPKGFPSEGKSSYHQKKLPKNDTPFNAGYTFN